MIRKLAFTFYFLPIFANAQASAVVSKDSLILEPLIFTPFSLGYPMEANDGGAYIPDPFNYFYTIPDSMLFTPTDTTDSLKIPIILDFPMHGGYKDLTPGNKIDKREVQIVDIKGGWRRIVSSGYYTPNGDAIYEPNEVHGSIYISDSKIYYLSYPERMHAYAEFTFDNGDMQLFDQKIMKDSLDWFNESPALHTKDSLYYLYFDGQYYRKEEMDESIVLELEQKIIRPEILIDDWVRQDSYWCCYGTENIMDYPWDMPENLHINKTWANKIYKKQKIYIEIEGELRPFFISWLSGDLMKLEPGSWFKGEADRVRYIRKWY